MCAAHPSAAVSCTPTAPSPRPSIVIMFILLLSGWAFADSVGRQTVVRDWARVGAHAGAPAYVCSRDSATPTSHLRRYSLPPGPPAHHDPSSVRKIWCGLRRRFAGELDQWPQRRHPAVCAARYDSPRGRAQSVLAAYGAWTVLRGARQRWRRCSPRGAYPPPCPTLHHAFPSRHPGASPVVQSPSVWVARSDGKEVVGGGGGEQRLRGRRRLPPALPWLGWGGSGVAATAAVTQQCTLCPLPLLSLLLPSDVRHSVAVAAISSSRAVPQPPQHSITSRPLSVPTTANSAARVAVSCRPAARFLAATPSHARAVTPRR